MKTDFSALLAKAVKVRVARIHCLCALLARLIEFLIKLWAHSLTIRGNTDRLLA